MTDEEQIVTRMLNVLPPRSFELLTFFSLFRVRFSDEVETACVTCSTAPELLLNKKFIEEHSRTDEHLLMLVMHELYHVILGHTRLFPRPDKISNIVFDAVINAVLCSLFPDPAKTPRQNSLDLCRADYEAKCACYEACYGKPLDYRFTPWDIAGWEP